MKMTFTSSAGRTFEISNVQSEEWEIYDENHDWVGFTHQHDEEGKEIDLKIMVRNVDSISRDELLAFCKRAWQNKAFL